MSRPKILVEIDGKPVSEAFFDRLVSLTITDREGIRSDALKLVFSDGVPHFASPKRGVTAKVSISANEGGGSFAGSYIIDRVENKCLPYTISVSGHSADLTAKMKTTKARHWDNKSIKQIVTEIAGDHGLEPRISDKVSGHVYVWVGQQDESDLHFLERLARRHGALFTIKSGKLLWLERGAGKTANGETIPTATVLSSSVIEGSCQVSETDVDRYGKIKAYYHDRKGAKRHEVSVEGDPEAKGEHTLRDPYSSKTEAEAAAKAYAREMLRGTVETSCSIIGRPALMAGQPMIYRGVRPGIDGRVFILETVTHTYTKSGGLRTSFSGKLKAET